MSRKAEFENPKKFYNKCNFLVAIISINKTLKLALANNKEFGANLAKKNAFFLKTSKDVLTLGVVEVLEDLGYIQLAENVSFSRIGQSL